MSRRPLFTLVALLAIVGFVKLAPFGSSETGQPAETERQRTDEIDRAAHRADRDLPIRLALGQMVVARFDGRDPSQRFLARVRRGAVGGVILFKEGLRGGSSAIAARVRRLQEAATGGGNPPLLIMVDQEGGTVKRLAGPPHLAASAMSAGSAEREGKATGELLDGLGINVDLAPVADVGRPGSFLGSRSFGAQPKKVANLACEFAAGLRSQGVAATLKHFPGLGRATVNTDDAPVTVEGTAAELRRDYAPYRRCADEPPTLVMVDSATYPSLTGGLPAVMAPSTYRRELPLAGVEGVTISDDLETPAIQNLVAPARRSINAGLDLLLYGQTESTSANAYSRLLEDIRIGALPRRKVQSAAQKILTLKREIGG